MHEPTGLEAALERAGQGSYHVADDHTPTCKLFRKAFAFAKRSSAPSSGGRDDFVPARGGLRHSFDPAPGVVDDLASQPHRLPGRPLPIDARGDAVTQTCSGSGSGRSTHQESTTGAPVRGTR